MQQTHASSSGIAPAFARAAALGRSRTQRPGWVRDDRHRLALNLLAWTLIVLMIVPENFDYAALSGGTAAAPTEGDTLSRLLWLGLLVGGVAVLVLRHGLAGQLLRHFNPWLLLFAGLAAASVAWSIAPEFTIRRMVRIATFIIDACALALMSWDRQRLQTMLRPIVTLMLGGSLLFGLLCPHLAIHQETSPELLGAWRGLANHKNSLGALSCIGMVLWAHAWLAGESPRWRAVSGFAAAFACLVLSRSDTSMLAALCALLLLCLLLRPSPAPPRRQALLAGAFIAALALYTLLSLHLVPGAGALLAPLTALAGKDTSFTGRAAIWELIRDHISQHPLLGTGYGAYWTGPFSGTQSYQVLQRLRFYPGSSHNGYLEVLNDLGLAGGLCLMGYLLTYLRQALRLLRLDPRQAALYLALLVQEMALNLSESHWFSVLSVNFAIFTMASIALPRALLEPGLRRHFGEPAPGRRAAGVITPQEPVHAEA